MKEAVVIYSKHKAKGGFTLMEIIISIAAVAFVSIFILEMFLASASLNHRARDTDKAMTEIVTAVENIKRFDSWAGYEACDIPGRVIRDSEDSQALRTVYFFYNKDFGLIETGTDNVYNNARYTLQIDIAMDEATLRNIELERQAPVAGAAKGGTLCGINATLKEGSRVLANISTKKYFPQDYVSAES